MADHIPAPSVSSIVCPYCAGRYATRHPVRMYALMPIWLTEKKLEPVFNIGICENTGLWIAETQDQYISCQTLNYSDEKRLLGRV